MSLTGVNIDIKATIKDLAVIGFGNTGERKVQVFEARNYANVFGDNDLANVVMENEEFDGKFIFDTEGREPEVINYYYTFGLVVDIAEYYPDICDIELTSVQSRYGNISFGALVHDKTKLLYLINVNSPLVRDNLFFDTIRYTVRDNASGEETSASVSFSRYKENLSFNDIHVELSEFYTGIIEVDLNDYNALMSDWTVTSFGPYNTDLIRDVRLSENNNRKVRITVAKECACWDCDQTRFAVYIQNQSDPSVAPYEFKYYVNLVKPCTDFVANPIHVIITGDVPEFVDIDIAAYNIGADAMLITAGEVDDSRGDLNQTSYKDLRYEFNRDTAGYWDRHYAEDSFAYTVKDRATGVNSTATVTISKRPGDARSGSSASGVLPTTPGQDYQIRIESELFKTGNTPTIPSVSTYEGFISIKDNYDNVVSLDASISIEHTIIPPPASGLHYFSGIVAGSFVTGRIKFTNTDFVSDAEGTMLMNPDGILNF